ncbi:hypothetical protein LUZ61_005933 [Rhynchospora tenuis]|uniref:Glycosyltransferase N-terminal domain-containing protein n=1 Tax=Rhynchospora tenuis TaxID=198213 RepID=A0AAD5ZQR8_9POAL|nr:hypothetical protein LUZ61_005933 [Rhynchospora tenuis]
MSTPATEKKRHALCLPFPAQGHISPMLTLAKLIHASGFHVTFVNTEFNHRRLIRSHGPTSLSAQADFQYMTIPDGLPYCDEDATQDIVSLCCSTRNTCLPHFRDLLDRLNEPGAGIPGVTCIIADPLMSFALDAAKEIEVPCSLVWFSNAYTLMGYLKCPELISRGLAPLEGMQYNRGIHHLCSTT